MPEDTMRFQIDLTERQIDTLEQLRLVSGCPTKTELFRDMMDLLKWAAKSTLTGRSIGSIGSDGSITTFDMPILSEMAERMPILSPEEIRKRLAEPSRPLSEILRDLEEKEKPDK